MREGSRSMCSVCGQNPQVKYKRGLCGSCAKARKEKAKAVVVEENRSPAKGLMPRVLDAVNPKEIKSIYCRKVLLDIPIASCDAEREQGCHCELADETDKARKRE